MQEYCFHGNQEAIAKYGNPPAHNTLHQEIVTLRQTLKTAARHGWLDCLPDLSAPSAHPPKSLIAPEATRKRGQEPKPERHQWGAEQLHDYLLFVVNSGLRPDEAWQLEFRDITIVLKLNDSVPSQTF